MSRRPTPSRPPDTRPASKPPSAPRYRTREEAITAAAYQLRLAYQEMIETPPREYARAAYVSGGPSVDQLERKVRTIRARFGIHDDE